MKIFQFITNFKKKYGKKAKSYAEDRRKGFWWAILAEMLIYPALTMLSIWGVFALFESGYGGLGILMIILSLSMLFMTLTELPVLAICAFRYTVVDSITNYADRKIAEKLSEEFTLKDGEIFVREEEITAEEKEEIDTAIKQKQTKKAFDIVVGILAILLSIALLVGYIFFVMHSLID